MKITCIRFSVLCLCAFQNFGETTVIFRKYPYGPKMCKLLSESTVGCTYATFDPSHLLCKEWTGSMRKSPQRGVVINITQTEEYRLSRKTCPVASRRIRTARKLVNCVKWVDLCPAGYHRLSSPRLCYKTHLEKLPWANARAVCREKEGDLISLDADEKYQVMKDILSNEVLSNKVNKEYRLWVGMRRRKKGKGYRWLTGTTYVPKWSPNDPGYDGQCIMLSPFGIADCFCNIKKGFICELQLSS